MNLCSMLISSLTSVMSDGYEPPNTRSSTSYICHTDARDSGTSCDPSSQESFISLHRDATDLQHRSDRFAVDAFQLQSTSLEQLEDESILHMKGFHPPIRRLPAETLGEIFSWAVEMEAVQGYSYTIDHSKSWDERLVEGGYTSTLPLQTLYLSQVCRLWRHIAMLSPLLWCFDNWAIPQSVVKPGASVINLVSHYFEMSKPLPLSLQLVGVGVAYARSPLTTKLAELVLSHSARLRYVLLEYTFPMAMELALRSREPSLVGGYFPNLEEADLRGPLPPETWPMLATEISAAPKLRSLVTDGFQFGPLAFPYNQLEELTLIDFEQRTDWVALSKFGLKRLILFQEDIDSVLDSVDGLRHLVPVLMTDLHATPVVCPSILSLRVNIGLELDCRVLGYLSGILILPSLEVLHLSFRRPSIELRPPMFKSLLLQLSSLKELCLDWQIMQRPDLCEMFQLVSGLTKLRYRCLPHFLAPLVDLLTVHKDDTDSSRAVFLPTLSHLDIGMVRGQIMDAITMMVASRWRQPSSNVASLESIILTHETGEKLYIPDELRALCGGAGFPLELQSGGLPPWTCPCTTCRSQVNHLEHFD